MSSRLRMLLPMCAILFSMACFSADDPIRILELSEPERSLYLSTFSDCPNCSTYAIVVSNLTPSKELKGAFRTLAEKAGKTHGGTVITPAEALKRTGLLRNFGCKMGGTSTASYVLFVDKEINYCSVFEYENEGQLVKSLNTIYSSIDDILNMEKEKSLDEFRLAVDQLLRGQASIRVLEGVMSFGTYLSLVVEEHFRNKRRRTAK